MGFVDLSGCLASNLAETPLLILSFSVFSILGLAEYIACLIYTGRDYKYLYFSDNLFQSWSFDISSMTLHILL